MKSRRLCVSARLLLPSSATPRNCSANHVAHPAHIKLLGGLRARACAVFEGTCLLLSGRPTSLVSGSPLGGFA